LDEQYKDLKDFLKDCLKDKISRVSLSEKLVKSPAAVVAVSYGYSANMERIMKAQALGQNSFKASPILEVNPNHPIIIELNNKIAIEGKDSQGAKDIAELLFETSALVSGYNVEKPIDFAERVHNLLKKNLGIPEDKPKEVPKQANDDDDKHDDHDDKHDEL